MHSKEEDIVDAEFEEVEKVEEKQSNIPDGTDLLDVIPRKQLMKLIKLGHLPASILGNVRGEGFLHPTKKRLCRTDRIKKRKAQRAARKVMRANA